MKLLKYILLVSIIPFISCENKKIDKQKENSTKIPHTFDNKHSQNKKGDSIKITSLDDEKLSQYEIDVIKIKCNGVIEETQKLPINLNDSFFFDKKDENKFFNETLYMQKTIKKPMVIKSYALRKSEKYLKSCFVEIRYQKGYSYKSFETLNKTVDWWIENHDLTFKHEFLFCFDFKKEKMIIVYLFLENYNSLLKVLKESPEIDKIILLSDSNKKRGGVRLK